MTAQREGKIDFFRVFRVFWWLTLGKTGTTEMHRRKTENTERKRPGVRIETSTLPKPQFITGDLFFFASSRLCGRKFPAKTQRAARSTPRIWNLTRLFSRFGAAVRASFPRRSGRDRRIRGCGPRALPGRARNRPFRQAGWGRPSPAGTMKYRC